MPTSLECYKGAHTSVLAAYHYNHFLTVHCRLHSFSFHNWVQYHLVLSWCEMLLK